MGFIYLMSSSCIQVRQVKVIQGGRLFAPQMRKGKEAEIRS